MPSTASSKFVPTHGGEAPFSLGVSEERQREKGCIAAWGRDELVGRYTRRIALVFCLVFALALTGLAQPGHDHDHGHDHSHGEERDPHAPPRLPNPNIERTAQIGDFVEVYYDLWVDNGDGVLNRTGPKRDAFLAATRDGQPFKLQIGQPGVIPGFSLALVGMKPGETKAALIPPKLGFKDLLKGIPANASLLLTVEMLSLQTDDQMQDILEEGRDGHQARANLPMIMDFMLKAFFKQPWIPRPDENPNPTRAMLLESVKVLFVFFMLALIGHFLNRRRSA